MARPIASVGRMIIHLRFSAMRPYSPNLRGRNSVLIRIDPRVTDGTDRTHRSHTSHASHASYRSYSNLQSRQSLLCFVGFGERRLLSQAQRAFDFATSTSLVTF